MNDGRIACDVSRCLRPGTETFVVSGEPDPDHISTSYIERQNLTMRMPIKRGRYAKTRGEISA